MPGPYLGSLGVLGYAKETTLGTPVAATNYVAFKDVSLEKEPGLYGIKLARQSRAANTYLMPGEQKIAGATAFPLASVMGMMLVAGSIGTEISTTGTTPTNSTTLASAAAAAATTITTTATFANGSKIQIDSNVSNKAECRNITAVSGAGPYTITLDTPLRFAHSSGATVANVVAPYLHTINEANVLPSFTLEKNLGGLTSIQYAGCVPGKLGLKAATKNNVDASIDWMAQTDVQPFTPSTPTYTADTPVTLAGVSASLLGSTDANVESFDFTLDNKIEPRYTFSGQRYPTFLPAVERTVNLKITESLQSMALYAQLTAANATGTPPSTQQILTLTAGSDVVTITMPQQAVAKYSDPIKVGSVIMVDVTFESWLGTQTSLLSMTVSNTQWGNF